MLLRSYGSSDSLLLLPVTGSPHFTSLGLAYHSVSNHLSNSDHRFYTLPLSVIRYFWASPFARRLASHSGRIEFVILRTGTPSSVALHLVSPQRSYFDLRAGESVPGRELSSLMPSGLMGARARTSSPQRLENSTSPCGQRCPRSH